MTNRKTILLAACAALTFAACQDSNAHQDAALAEISAKLDKLEAKVDKLQGQRPDPSSRQPRKRATPGQLYKVEVSPKDAYRGGKHAKVTMVQASEFACPYCAKLAAATEDLLEHYEDEELKVVSKPFVVHPQTATLPALAACAASKQGRFGEFEAELWKQAWPGGESPRLERSKLGEPALLSIAAKLGLDEARFKEDMKGECNQYLQGTKRALTTLGVSGTPAVYINGVYYGGPRTAEALKAAIDKELKTADAALAKGASLESYYAQRIAKGKASL